MKNRNFERRIIYFLLVLVILVPIVSGVRLKPAPMKTANVTFEYIDSLGVKVSDTNPEIKRSETKPGAVVLALDFGPGTAAENKPQAKLVIEHLMRKRIPFVLTSIYVLAAPFLQQLPLEIAEALEAEMPGEKWVYGKDWVNIGFMPNGIISIQSLAKSKDWWGYLKFDVEGRSISELPIMQNIKSIHDISTLVQITGLQGVFSAWLQFFQIDGAVPVLIHGCTSITIPEAYNFFTSGQLRGFFEGIAGAAWYEQRLYQEYPDRKIDAAMVVNTGTSFAQLFVFGMVIFGNLLLLISVVKRP
ncbi:MAG TPA: hypothetical protein PKA63_11925 [Oligoflexia bacterium]|nr:hypothetical protein [Oligoflexia bacterium]HMP49362.1 hypothetical protein [Oligoflexia bacterium]